MVVRCWDIMGCSCAEMQPASSWREAAPVSCMGGKRGIFPKSSTVGLCCAAMGTLQAHMLWESKESSVVLLL